MLPWEFYLQDTIPYTLVCHVTPDPNTRFKRKKKEEKNQQQNKQRKPNLAEQAACFHPQRIVGIVVLGEKKSLKFFFFSSFTDGCTAVECTKPVHQVLRVHWLSQNAMSLPSSSAAMFM